VGDVGEALLCPMAVKDWPQGHFISELNFGPASFRPGECRGRGSMAGGNCNTRESAQHREAHITVLDEIYSMALDSIGTLIDSERHLPALVVSRADMCI
jgi:hypothetical protein